MVAVFIYHITYTDYSHFFLNQITEDLSCTIARKERTDTKECGFVWCILRVHSHAEHVLDRWDLKTKTMKMENLK